MRLVRFGVHYVNADAVVYLASKPDGGTLIRLLGASQYACEISVEEAIDKVAALLCPSLGDTPTADEVDVEASSALTFVCSHGVTTLHFGRLMMEKAHRRVQLRFVAGQVDAFVDAEQLDAFIAAVASSTDPKAAQLLAIVEHGSDEVDDRPWGPDTADDIEHDEPGERAADEVDEVQP